MSDTKILVVDDDPVVRRTLNRLLQAAGYAITIVDAAEQAVGILDTSPIDIVLSDINMPGLSGLDLLKNIRNRNSRCEVILMTGFATVDNAVQALRDGVFDFLTKPVEKDLLLDCISRAETKLLESRRQQEALAMINAGLQQFTDKDAPKHTTLPPATPTVERRQFHVGAVLLDLDRFLIEVEGRVVDATPTEIEIFHHLCLNPDRVLTPQELVRWVRGYSLEANEANEMIRPHISNLRRKILGASAQADVIVTVRTVGYMLKTPPDS